ncbi:flavin monoamine oxidase family protein [Lishizhenia sp.]|uniref:flavin monoamine oxidase family protein n=1 Tax=Lishizhenia sp. TaxID=2497594 RepID=UPI00299DFCEE|nr:FAD-dependent oxidoreductase [Lishizhenia sp.]MDX1446028.1 FAD-dependent oxidoreductase [Lishizhenia sp.]
MKPGITNNIKTQDSDPKSWVPNFPNPADFRFDYFKLLKESPNGLAKLEQDQPSVAIMGAGVAGVTAARELLRCGYKVTLFEASNRIGGRLYTLKNPLDKGIERKHAGLEMGAMRMPFFSKPGDENCLLGYYLNHEPGRNKAILTPFPNPGAAPGNTGIYINKGFGPKGAESEKPSMIFWPLDEDGVRRYPKNEVLQKLCEKVEEFGKNFQQAAKQYYTQNNELWTICWRKLRAHYQGMSFKDLVLEPSLDREEILHKIAHLEDFDGDLGGFGMTAEEANLLYIIGTGDGSWGAFYDIGAMWFIRCTYFGFDSNLQTVEGLAHPEELPYFMRTVLDSSTPQKAFEGPSYEGIQGLAEYLMFAPLPGEEEKSLFTEGDLFMETPVTKIKKTEKGVLVYSEQHPEGQFFDKALVTSTKWAAQLSMDFEGFPEEELPQDKIIAAQTQHNISSCKLFFPLKARYWDKEQFPDCKIPQVLVTDTLIQDMYGLAWSNKPEDPGVILASYTWEDDSLKLLAFNNEELSDIVLKELKSITMETLGEDITEYIDTTKPVSIQWIKEPTYLGCSKLYRAHNEAENMIDLGYNEHFAKASHLYFAGENYGVEGGWTEPALRSALDCVLHMIKHTPGAVLQHPNFSLEEDYPSWPTYDYKKEEQTVKVSTDTELFSVN